MKKLASTFLGLLLTTFLLTAQINFTDANWVNIGNAVSPGPQNGSCGALAADRLGNVYVGGYFTTIGGVSAINIARWDGTNWYPLGVGGSSTAVDSLALDGKGTNVITGSCTPGYNYALDLDTQLSGKLAWMPQATNSLTAVNTTFTNAPAAKAGIYRLRYVP